MGIVQKELKNVMTLYYLMTLDKKVPTDNKAIKAKSKKTFTIHRNTIRIMVVGRKTSSKSFLKPRVPERAKQKKIIMNKSKIIVGIWSLLMKKTFSNRYAVKIADIAYAIIASLSLIVRSLTLKSFTLKSIIIPLEI